MPTGRTVSAFWLTMIGAVLVVLGCCVPLVRNMAQYNLRSRASAAYTNLPAIAGAEQAYFKAHGTFVGAGPVPAAVPRLQKVEFVADDGFKAIPWQPGGFVYYQYEVQVAGPKSAVVFARGDLNGDGKQSEFRLEVRPDAPLGEVVAKDPLE